MVKGISRRVVVVDSPDQRFFEQAIFIVRNDAAGEGVTARELVEEALKMAGRTDLIGYGPKCLLRPEGGRPPSNRKCAKEAGKKTRTIRNIHKKKGRNQG